MELGQWQQKIYRDIEKPRFIELCDVLAREFGTITELLNFMNENIKKAGHPKSDFITNNEFSGLKRGQTPKKSRRDGWTDRILFKFAIGLNLDKDPAWGLVGLRMYLNNLIEENTLNGLKSRIALIKSAANIEPVGDDVPYAIGDYLAEADIKTLCEIISRASGFIYEASQQQENADTSLYSNILNAFRRFSLTTADLLSSTALTTETLQNIAEGKTVKRYELQSLADWFHELMPDEGWSYKVVSDLVDSNKIVGS